MTGGRTAAAAAVASVAAAALLLVDAALAWSRGGWHAALAVACVALAVGALARARSERATPAAGFLLLGCALLVFSQVCPAEWPRWWRDAGYLGALVAYAAGVAANRRPRR